MSDKLESKAETAAKIAYSPVAAAVAVDRSRTRIFGAIKSGELTARKDGKATIIEHDELVRWVKSLPVLKTKANPIPSAQGNG